VIFAIVNATTCIGIISPHRVSHHPQCLNLLENRIGLVAGTEVKDAPLADLPHSAAAEVLALVALLLKHDLVGRRHMGAVVCPFIANIGVGFKAQAARTYHPIPMG
jgi:hypothetical protein